ncbi:MAG TPA: hypothetical protein VE155_00695 [Pseudonocardiaceae bacterium]|nr:hypothetical protein [Pseudonocardiaceae bacterium]
MTVVRRNGSQDHLSDDAVNELRTRLSGQVVVVPEDPDARTEPGDAWNAHGSALLPNSRQRCLRTAESHARQF